MTAVREEEVVLLYNEGSLSLSLSLSGANKRPHLCSVSVRSSAIREGCAEVCQRLCGMCRVNFLGRPPFLPKEFDVRHSVKLKVKKRARIVSPLRAKSVCDLSPAGAPCNSSITESGVSLNSRFCLYFLEVPLAIFLDLWLHSPCIMAHQPVELSRKLVTEPTIWANR